MICGFLVLDKPEGLTSHSCVAQVRRAYGLKRVGHGGTLDPSVTGVLPIALGPATRLLPYLPGDKSYRGTIQLGLCTTTDDLQGEVLRRFPLPRHLDRAALDGALGAFRGPILQRPPAFSAVHVQGQRAYALARAGQQLELEPRSVTFHRIDLLAWDPEAGTLALEMVCSAGTYIRSLARDLGEALGGGGALASLRRTAALGFQLRDSVALEALRDPLPPLLEPLSVFPHLPQHPLTPAEAPGWRCGRALVPHQPFVPGDVVAVVAPDGKLAGLAEARAPGVLQPRMVLDAHG